MRRYEWYLYRLFGYRFYNKKTNVIHRSTKISHINSLEFKDFVYIGPGANIMGSGSLSVGINSIIGPNLTVYTTGHTYRSESIPYDSKDDFVSVVKVEDNVWIGGNVVILPGITIEEGAVIGAGSLVTKDVKKYAVVGGNPAKVINYRDEKLYNNMIEESKLYFVNKMARKR